MLDKKITPLEDDVKSMKSNISELIDRVESLENKVSKIDERIIGLEGKTTQLSIQIDTAIIPNMKLVAQSHINLSNKLDDALKIVCKNS